MSHFSLPFGNYKLLDKPCAPNFPKIYTFEENEPQGWFSKLKGKCYWNFIDSIKNFVLPCINRPVPRDSLSPYNLSLVEDGYMYWTASKQKILYLEFL